MAEDLTDYLLEYGFKVRYLHSEIDTLERIQIIRELRLGEFDVLVGVNLLREGLDLPEVSLVAILDADKEGFLRGETSLIQTIGRAARNIRGKVIMYADKETAAMRTAIGETDRRRAIQVAYNEEHGITPATIQKGISDITDFLMMESKVPSGRGRRTARHRGHVGRGAAAHDRGAGGGDARRRRRPALRVRGQAARRDQGAAARAGGGRGKRVGEFSATSEGPQIPPSTRRPPCPKPPLAASHCIAPALALALLALAPVALAVPPTGSFTVTPARARIGPTWARRSPSRPVRSPGAATRGR